jgi:parallel beta-helix repeat protein
VRFRHCIDKTLVLCAIASLLAFLAVPAVGAAQGVKTEGARAKAKGGHRGHAHKHHKKHTKQRAKRTKPATVPAVHQAVATVSASASARRPSTPRTPPAGGEIPIPANALYVSSATGSDSNPGTSASPWRSIAKAASSAGPGDVVVLMPGTYGAPGTTTYISTSGTASAPITFTSLPGSERAVIKGYVRIGGSHILVNSLDFDGPTGPVLARTSENPGGEEVQVSIMYGSDVELAHSEIRDNAWHAGVFVYAGSEIRIDSNYIHNNGDAATGANLDHGVYWCSGSGSVTNNLVEDNVAYGVHLYPEANEVIVAGNTIAGNGRGGIIVANTSSQNQLLNNVVTDNAMYGIRGYDLSGKGNVARDNLLWDNGENISGSGIAYSGTLVQPPPS